MKIEDVKRLFDWLPYQAANYPQEDCICAKENGNWRKYSSAQAIEQVDKVAKAFIGHDIQKEDKIALISNNRPEWNFVDQGMLKIGAVNVPIYPTISENDYKFIFNDAEIKIAFVSDDELYQKIKNIAGEVPTLQHIYSFDDVEGCASFNDFLAKGENTADDQVEAAANAVEGKDMATIIYTSGTTGTPKGVMISHYNIVENIKMIMPILPLASPHTALSFLPLCHIFERVVTYTYFGTGVSIYYSPSMDPADIRESIAYVKPHFFTTVPRLLEKVYEAIMKNAQQLSGIKKALFMWAMGLAKEYKLHDRGWWYDFRHGIADKLIYSKIRERLGGRILGIVTGAAKLPPHIGRVFTAAGIKVREGYGQTESAVVVTVNRFEEEGAKFDTIGLPIPGVEVKLGPNDEILVKSPSVMMGYYKRQDLTDQTIDKEGYLHTGDVGTWVDGKFLKITGRVKELFKTSGGKYVAPQVIENKIKESPFVEQICVIGENRKFVSALIVPSLQNLSDWATKNLIQAGSPEDLVEHPDVVKLFQDEIDSYKHHFGHVEQIKKFKLLPEEWTVDSGIMTPTMKVKRKVLNERFGKDIEAIYEG